MKKRVIRAKFKRKPKYIRLSNAYQLVKKFKIFLKLKKRNKFIFSFNCHFLFKKKKSQSQKIPLRLTYKQRVTLLNLIQSLKKLKMKCKTDLFRKSYKRRYSCYSQLQKMQEKRKQKQKRKVSKYKIQLNLLFKKEKNLKVKWIKRL